MNHITERWQLNGYLIEYVGDQYTEYWWIDFLYMGDNGFETLEGKAWINKELDCLVMSPWKVYGDADFETEKESEEFLNSLPKWDKTTYFAKFGDIEATLQNCKTLELTSFEIQNQVMPKLGFKRKKVLAYR